MWCMVWFWEDFLKYLTWQKLLKQKNTYVDPNWEIFSLGNLIFTLNLRSGVFLWFLLKLSFHFRVKARCRENHTAFSQVFPVNCSCSFLLIPSRAQINKNCRATNIPSIEKGLLHIFSWISRRCWEYADPKFIVLLFSEFAIQLS